MDIIGKIRYKGIDIDFDVIDGNVYDVRWAGDGLLGVIDESGDSYIYSATSPASLMRPEMCGMWEVVEDETGEITKAINGYK